MLEAAAVENETEPFVLRLIILWLMTASCYGVQLLLFRERVSEEEERKSAARNDELKAAGRLAAEIAHQLKNPLGIINNAVFSLQRGLKEGKKDFNQQITIIREEIDRSDRILTQLMGYAQLSEGRVEKLNVVEELDRAIAEVLPSGASYMTQVHRDYGASLPAMLMQRNHLSVVLVNLLQNAREALNGKGNIQVHAHYGDNHTLQIVIGDDGPGIPFDKLDKIFEAYVTTKEKGTGLGLAIVKHNVELYGGAVRAESELGKGARFILLFPAKTFIVTDP
jgi:signal transduction histidine kinase